MPAHHVCSTIFIHVEYLRFGNQTHHEPNEMTEGHAVIDYISKWKFSITKNTILLTDYQDYLFLSLVFY